MTDLERDVARILCCPDGCSRPAACHAGLCEYRTHARAIISRVMRTVYPVISDLVHEKWAAMEKK